MSTISDDITASMPEAVCQMLEAVPGHVLVRGYLSKQFGGIAIPPFQTKEDFVNWAVANEATLRSHIKPTAKGEESLSALVPDWDDTVSVCLNVNVPVSRPVTEYGQDSGRLWVSVPRNILEALDSGSRDFLRWVIDNADYDITAADVDDDISWGDTEVADAPDIDWDNAALDSVAEVDE